MQPLSILAYLASSMTDQLENLATFSLAHLLKQYPRLNEAFREFISSAGLEIPSNLSIDPQKVGKGGERPDLVFADKEGSNIILIEAKFLAWLTDNQPVAYIDNLPPEKTEKTGMLLFIAPVCRLEDLWGQINERCADKDRIKLPKNETRNETFRTLRLNGGHILALTSWESLLAVLQKKAQEVEDKFAENDIWQLQSLCEQITKHNLRKLRNSDDYKTLVTDIVRRLIDSGIVSTKTPRGHLGWGGNFTRYIVLRGIYCLHIEYNETLSKKTPETKLWLRDDESGTLTEKLTPECISRLKEKHGIKYDSQDHRWRIALEIPKTDDYQAIVRSLCEQIDAVSKLLIAK